MLAALALSAVLATAPVQLIIDTDLGFDVDDVGALAVAHALSDQGLVDILGVVCNTGRDACIIGTDIVNTYYGRANMTSAPSRVNSAATRTMAKTGTTSTT